MNIAPEFATCEAVALSAVWLEIGHSAAVEVPIGSVLQALLALTLQAVLQSVRGGGCQAQDASLISRLFFRPLVHIIDHVDQPLL